MQPVLVIEQEHSLRGLGLLGDRLDASGLPYRQLRGWDERLDELEARDFSGDHRRWAETRTRGRRAFRSSRRNATCSTMPSRKACRCSGSASVGSFSRERSAATSARPKQPEIGWLEIAPTEDAAADPVLGHLTAPTGVYQWHHDVIELPPGARRLASSPLAPNQAFRADGTNAWGIQFHPEVDAQLFETWISRHPEEVREAGVDVDALRDDRPPRDREVRSRFRCGSSTPSSVSCGARGTRSRTRLRDRHRRCRRPAPRRAWRPARARGRQRARSPGARDRAWGREATVLDAAEPEAVRAFADEAAEALGGLDAAWSNVGVQIAATAETATVEELDRSWAINVRAHAVLCGAAVPHLRAAGGGPILVTASNSALLSEPGMLPYAVTKAAALALARQVARDFAGDRIRVNALCPGWVDTPFNEPAWRAYGGRESVPRIRPQARPARADLDAGGDRAPRLLPAL